MARYQLMVEGVHDSVTAQDITPANYSEWLAYQSWLAAGNVPDPIAIVSDFPTLASQRTEALARLYQAFIEHSIRGVVLALGHQWRVSAEFILLLTLYRAAFPPFPAAFTLPDADGVQVAINNADLNTLIAAFGARGVAVNAVNATLRAAVLASATPLTVTLSTGWPS